MKKNSLVRLIVFTASSLFFSGAYSQLSAEKSYDSNIAARPSAFKANAVGADADKMALESLKSVNTRMFTHFNKNFRKATDIHVRPEATHTQISFKEDGVSNSVQYSKRGKWLYSIRTYDESKLNEGIRNDVEIAYPGFRVFGFVNEIDVLNKSAMLVMIENKNLWRRIRITEDNMDVYEEYKKPK